MQTNSITPAQKAQPAAPIFIGYDTYLASIGFMYPDYAPESHLMLLAYCQRNGYDPIGKEAYLYRDDEGHEIVLDATRAILIQRGYTPAKAQKCALDRNKLLHPSHQVAVRRNIAANRDYIQGGAQ